MKKISRDQAVREDWDQVRSWNYKGQDSSVVYAELDGDHGWVQTAEQERHYYILEGEGVFVSGTEEVVVQAGDVLILEPHLKYDYHPTTQTLKVLLFMEVWDN